MFFKNISGLVNNDAVLEQHRKNLIAMSGPEKTKLSDYLKLIDRYDSADEASLQQLKDMCKALPKFASKEAYKFSENNQNFKEFCEIEHSPWAFAFAKTLHSMDYVNINITSLDGKPISILNQYKAAYLISHSNNEATPRAEAELSLALACKLSSYHAFTERCAANQEKITNDDNDEAEKTVCKEKLFSDLDALGCLYGVAGFAHASQVLLEIGHYYKKQQEDGLATLATEYYEKAVYCYYAMKALLVNNEISAQDAKIIKAICKDETILEYYNYQGWDEAEEDILSRIEDVDVKVQLMTEATTQITALTNLGKLNLLITSYDNGRVKQDKFIADTNSLVTKMLEVNIPENLFASYKETFSNLQKKLPATLPDSMKSLKKNNELLLSKLTVPTVSDSKSSPSRR